MSKIKVVDAIMGAGKTSWAIQEVDKHLDKNILYISPTLEQVDDFISKTKRKIYQPENKGNGKLGNIIEMIESEVDIASTHALFKMFDEEAKAKLREHKYILLLDETIDAVEPYSFNHADDFKHLLDNSDVSVSADGTINWTGKDLDTRYNDVKILAQNHCLFRVDDVFFVWHYPITVFDLFDEVFIMTYNFDGSLMKPYFDLYGVEYEIKSIKQNEDGSYSLTDYYIPDLEEYRNRIDVFSGENLLTNYDQKDNVLSSTWSGNRNNDEDIEQLRKNMNNYRIMQKAKSGDILWTCYQKIKTKLSGKGYARSYLSSNARGLNSYDDRTVLMFMCNWYPHIKVLHFFNMKGIPLDTQFQEQYALNNLIQWIWRSNIRRRDSNKIIHVYIPSHRMRRIFNEWLYAT